MINFSIDYLTRKENRSGSDSDGSSGSSTAPETRNLSVLSSSDASSSESSDSLSPKSESAKIGKGSGDKPSHSYIALISMSILNSPEKKVLLGDIYQYIMDNFPYYNNKEKAWRNSIRHNLSLNECFIKSGRADNGKGNYWSIHPACIEDFSRGDFRRRQARRRARKSTMPEMNVSELPMSYRCNLGYVPMTTSALPYSNANPAMYYPSTPFTSNPMPTGLSYSPMVGPPAASPYVHPSNSSQSFQNILHGSQNISW
ncbi:hypothetical protein SNE40_005057 [Patella caerulea]|uniref:Fork-head domain-containing protein n=1 Tax=Patella caerulea TaxID=87958 RepID=A0AAN8QD94_PATCE